ncbi:MAG: AAA family ATPase, partial [Armatimonadetes bacterium]|nr:AAA family ATPase [Armatimonadota bacterium]
MGIERIEIEGFRSLKHVVWEPSNLKVLIGPNGSGKSNTIRALEMLSSAAKGKLQEAIDGSGGLPALTWNHGRGALNWIVHLTSPSEAHRGMPLGSEKEGRTSYQLAMEGMYRGDVLADVGITEEHLTHAGAGTHEPKILIRRGAQEGEVFDEFGTRIGVKRLDVREALLGLDGLYVSADAVWVRDMVRSWMCYQDMSVAKDAKLRGSAQTRRMDVVQGDGQNLVSVLHTHYVKNLDFRSAIDDAMRAAFGDDYAELAFPPAEDTRVQLRLRWKSLSELQSAADLSDGILRFLLLVTILSQPYLPPLVAIDEPETGLHPSMLPIIAEYAVEASRKTQVI